MVKGGTSMKCKHCDGDGVIVDVEYGHAGKYGCKYCDGKGVVEPLTEQEWLQTCTTEQLADVFYMVFHNHADRVLNAFWDKHKDVFKKDIVEWLKQPHIPLKNGKK